MWLLPPISLALLAAAAALSPLPALSAPAPSADDIIRQAFDNYRAGSSEAQVTMTIHRPAWERHLEMKTWTRGIDDALVRFLAPPKDAGNATLKLGSDTWIYNPKLNQVIKLPSSMLSQSWMGSDFSYSDLAKSADIVTQFTHELGGSTQAGSHTVWTLVCVPKPGAPVVWGKVTLQVRDDYVLMGQTFYDQDMKAARQMTAERIESIGGRTYPVVMTMRPLDEPDQWTRIETSQARFNIPLPAYLFTLSNLQNPRS
jgi:outer membrane lipoprotein-sorting protein